MNDAPLPPASTRRKAAYGVILVVLVFAAIEAISLLGLSVKYRLLVTPAVLEAMRSPEAGQSTGQKPALTPDASFYPQFVVHPFLGYVLDSDFDRATRLDAGGEDALNFGFQLTERGIFHPPDDRALVVAVTGGSVAFGLTLHFADELKSQILSGIESPVEDVVIVNLALPGYKQPQQLLLLNYLLTLGAHFDVVVNLDGFNEIALAPTENLPRGVAPIFPHAWYYRVADFDPETRLVVGELMLEKRRRHRLAKRFDRKPLAWSSTAGLVWTLLDRHVARRIGDIEVRLSKLQSSADPSFTVTGPNRPYDTERQMVLDLARSWERASILMNGLCQRSGVEYLHFLQPNQYLAGSKEMGEHERLSAINFELQSSGYAEMGYPLLKALGERLGDGGVHFVDLTMLFAATAEQTYSDDCCHYTEIGEQMVASAIALEITKSLGADS